MRNYYRREGVRQAIIDFVYSGSTRPLREGAFYKKEIDGIQRHPPEGNGGDSVLVFDSEEAFSRVLRAGARAFYVSYWRYSDPFKAHHPKGRDLVWSLKAVDGGISAAKETTSLFLEALEEEGFSYPLVKYSGELGFDVLVPLEDVQTGSPDDLDFLSKIQKDLTERASDYISAQGGFKAESDGSRIRFTGRMGTCLLTELRWRRGLLLAPMSLHPSSGLVSIPLLPDEVSEFSTVRASPEKIRPREWSIDRSISGRKIEPSVLSSPRGIPIRT